MRKICKYALKHSPASSNSFSFYTEMPWVARIIKCGFQNGNPFVWALVDNGINESRTIPFLILPTWDYVPETAHHLETAFNGDLVWHFFVVEGSHGVSAHP